MAKEFLSKNQIHYEEKDVNVDAEARSQFMSLKLRGVPAFLIGDEVVVGLDTERILELVDHRLVLCEACGTKMRVPINKGIIAATCPKCGHSQTADPKK